MRIINASKIPILETVSLMTELLVNNRAKSWQNTTMRTENTTPIALEVVAETIIANLAPLPFPATSSLAILTLK